MLLPIYTLPLKVLSCIFQHVVSSTDYFHTTTERFRTRIEQGFDLSSVSAHFRHVAFGTPELWKEVPLCLTDDESIRHVLSLLQHCIALVANINISVTDALDEGQAGSAIETLLIPDITRRVKDFELDSSTHAPELWIEKLKGRSFPILDTLDIACGERELTLDLGSLNTLTRVMICELLPGRPIIMPPSVRYLNLRQVPKQILVAILYQCPNIEECDAFSDIESEDYSVDAQID